MKFHLHFTQHSIRGALSRGAYEAPAANLVEFVADATE